MILTLSKIYRLRANKLLKMARENITVEKFSTGVNRFLPFFKEFIKGADEDQQEGLNAVSNSVADYLQLMISTVYAFDQKDWVNAHNGFVNANQRADEIISQIEHLKSQDPEVFLYIDGRDEMDLSESIEEVINLGRSLITDKFRTYFDEIEKAKTDNPEAFQEREIEDTGPEEVSEDDHSEIEKMLGYRQEGDPSQNITDTTVDTENIVLDQREKERRKYLRERRKKRMYALLSSDDPEKKKKFYELLKKFREAKSRWNKNYYTTKFKNSDKYKPHVAATNARKSKNRKDWYKYEAFLMKPEALEALKTKNPQEYAKVMERREFMARLKLRNLDEFNAIIKGWQRANTLRKGDTKSNDKKKDDRRNKNLEDLLNRLNRGQY